MENHPGSGHRATSRASKLRRKRARWNLILLAGLAAAVVLLVLITPKEPLRRAVYSSGTESGEVESAHRHLSQYLSVTDHCLINT